MSVSSAKKQVDKLMTKFDKDNNGLLSEQEFVNGCMNDAELLKFFLPNKWKTPQILLPWGLDLWSIANLANFEFNFRKT